MPNIFSALFNGVAGFFGGHSSAEANAHTSSHDAGAAHSFGSAHDMHSGFNHSSAGIADVNNNMGMSIGGIADIASSIGGGIADSGISSSPSVDTSSSSISSPF